MVPLKNAISIFFYGNIFLGIYAVALCVETSLLNHLPLNTLIFYLLIFFGTCIYYTMIYVRSAGAKTFDERTLWYRTYLVKIKLALRVAIAAVVLLATGWLFSNFRNLVLLPLFQILLLLIIPLVAAWYTFSLSLLRLKKIRQTGWIKPFIVGFTWAGWVIVYPMVLLQVHTRSPTIDLALPVYMFLQNFLFFSINAIIFDVRDYRTDRAYRLKTFPVMMGIKGTFRYVVWPLIVLDLFVFSIIQVQQQFSILQTLVQLTPYLLLILIVARHKRQRSVLYYLAAVDGLVFVKAISGIASILFFKK